jgi:hypothetical protein
VKARGLPEVKGAVSVEVDFLEHLLKLGARREADHGELPLEIAEHEGARAIVVCRCTLVRERMQRSPQAGEDGNQEAVHAGGGQGVHRERGGCKGRG